MFQKYSAVPFIEGEPVRFSVARIRICSSLVDETMHALGLMLKTSQKTEGVMPLPARSFALSAVGIHTSFAESGSEGSFPVIVRVDGEILTNAAV